MGMMVFLTILVSRLRIILLLTAYNKNQEQMQQVRGVRRAGSEVGQKQSKLCGGGVNFDQIKSYFTTGLYTSDLAGTGILGPEEVKQVINLRHTLIQLRLSQELINQLTKLQTLQGSLMGQKLGLPLQMSTMQPAQKLQTPNSGVLRGQSTSEENKKFNQFTPRQPEQQKGSSVQFDQHLQQVLIEKEQEKNTLKRQISNSQSEFLQLLAEVPNPDRLIFKGQPRGKFRRNGQPFTSSEYRGVSKNGKKYQMFIMVNGKRKMYIGGYEYSAEAARAYDRAAIQMRGIKARTNFSYNKCQVLEILNSPPVFPMEDENLKETFSIWRNYQMQQGHL